MIKKNKWKLLITSLIVLLPVFIGLILWNQLPDSIVTHWNGEGIADGYSNKAYAVFALPVFMLFIHWLCILFTLADPKNKNISGKPLELVFWLCPVISLVCNLLTYITALGMEINVSLVMPICMGILFVIIGNYLPKCRQNYTMGIKIPWTLNNEENWNHTHRFAGPVWVAGGILMILAAFLQSTALLLLVIFVLILLPVIYSFVYHKKYEDKQEEE